MRSDDFHTLSEGRGNLVFQRPARPPRSSCPWDASFSPGIKKPSTGSDGLQNPNRVTLMLP